MNRVQKPSNSECHTLSSEPFRIYPHDKNIIKNNLSRSEFRDIFRHCSLLAINLQHFLCSFTHNYCNTLYDMPEKNNIKQFSLKNLFQNTSPISSITGLSSTRVCDHETEAFTAHNITNFCLGLQGILKVI
jgi:hypothetical protein